MALLALSAAALLSLPPAPVLARPCRAVDGDTVQCGTRERFRVRHISPPLVDLPDGNSEYPTPEPVSKYGKAALAQLQSDLPARGEAVLLRRNRDRHGRTVVDLYADGIRVAASHIGSARCGARHKLRRSGLPRPCAPE
jgi:endonuclease YncB( thermonuclease family)